MKRLLCSLATVCMAISAEARMPDRILGNLIEPHDGMPAIVLPGQSFEVLVREKAEIQLHTAGGSVPLSVTWKESSSPHAAGTCTISENLLPGLYALSAGEDRTERAVAVIESPQDTYQFAHLTDCNIGSNAQSRPSEVIFDEVVQKLNESTAEFAVITGGLTASGTGEEYRRFLECLNQCTKPTFVCSGTTDGPNYDLYFSRRTYTFTYGQDGFLVFDTSDLPHGSATDEDAGRIERLRESIKPLRWSIGFTHWYDPRMNMRTQLALFVDDPLDLLFFGHWRRANREGETHVPWGTTPINVTPAALDGAIQGVEIRRPPQLVPVLFYAAPVE